MKKIICVLMTLCFVLCGCGGKEDTAKTKVCTMEFSGIKMTQNLEYKGDVISKQTITNETTLDLLGVEKSVLEASMETTKEAYAIDGVTYESSIDEEGNVKEVITVDFTKADFDELKAVGLVSAEEDEKIGFIGLEVTVTALEDFGYTCSDK